MKLTTEQQNKLLTTLKVGPSCPNCEFTGQMNLQTNEYQLTSTDYFSESDITEDEITFMPLAAVVCPNCGYLRLFNLEALGLV